VETKFGIKVVLHWCPEEGVLQLSKFDFEGLALRGRSRSSVRKQGSGRREIMEKLV
jgi:hypothetical protein